ncbi:MAG: hypothetical protein KDA28_02685 [Phycisphaerales bacterium]|nr:hypothetical protein [Phycisphaerales bacterium]
MGTIDGNPTLVNDTAKSGFASLDSNEFMEIILTELSNQDPLEPNDTGAMLEQLSAIRSIESDTTLSDRLQSLVTQNEFASAANLIGSMVSGLTEDGRRTIGTVDSVSRTADGAILNLDTLDRVPIGLVDEVISGDLL